MSSALLLIALGIATAPGDEATPSARAELELVVIERGAPAPGVRLEIDGVGFGATNAHGALLTEIPSGRATVVLTRGGAEVKRLDLLTDAGELVQMILTLREGREPELIIESSGRDPVLAGEATQTSTAAAREGPSAAPGALSGTVRALSGEPVEGAQIYFSGIDAQVSTDAEGKFAAELPAGTYSLSVIQPAFANQTLDDIRVIPGKEVSLTIELSPAGTRLEDYVVTAPYVEGSVASVLGQQREASGVSDVLGAAQISAAGDSDAAGALARVTGLSVEDGKFVLIRGQPYRFTLALFNGSPLPSPEPLLQVVPLDLFPTGVLKSIEVVKSYSPEYPGAFGAGLVKLNTRGVPDEGFFEVSIGTKFNTQSVFQQGRTYEGGGLDFLGIDDGTRALPDQVREATEDGTRSLNALPPDELAAAGASFTNLLDADEATLPPDFGISISGGESVDIGGGGKLGFVGTTSYGNKWRFQERIQRSFSLSNDELRVRNDLVERRTDNDIDLSGLFTLAAEWENHRIASNTFVVNQTQKRTQFTTGRLIGSDQLDIRDFFLSWIERFLIAQQLTGRHDFGWLQIDYRGLFAQTNRGSPDQRSYQFSRTPDQETFFVRDPTGLRRGFSDVSDRQLAAGLDLTFEAFEDEEAWFRPTFKTGFAVSRVDRSAREQRFLWTPDDQGGADRSNNNPEEVFDPTLTGTQLRLRDNSILGADDYDGAADVLGVYAMADIGFWDIFRLSGGVRWETSVYEVSSFQAAAETVEVQSTGFEQEDFLPAASLTWFALDELQVRATYGRTLSRPVFNELSPSFFIDPDSGQEFQGSPDLVPTKIDGYDVRAEWYPSSTETLTLGVFMKDYTDPLERTFVSMGGGGQLATFQNAASARVLGLEVGGRFEAERIRELVDGPDFIDDIYLSANLALLQSDVTLATQGIATTESRPLDGQADFVLNVQGGFDGEEHDITIAFNMVGTRLRRAGILGQPNIFMDPIPDLDLSWRWQLIDAMSLKVGVDNLLDPSYTFTQQTGDQEPQVFRQYTRGTTFSVSLAYEPT